ncbi:DNA ligase D [Luteimonas vadosa]|uniref:DNA ligase (ATP) n=1 Tax=Luteimonas vadosa TaxID=1165507 RepID=A0ABP9DQY4_9GAMM
MGLRDYARKRRFDATPEPEGRVVETGGRRPVFVVQLHHARARHYDFRLEVDGVLKSWAVPKGPSLRPGDKRLAVQVEDHPLEYAGFAGDIPEGNYGAGHVDIFDRGHWASDGDPQAALAQGKLDFVLQGGKLRGGWKLVRTRKQGRQVQWLLMKRQDRHAAELEADDLIDDAGAGAGARAKAKARPKKTGKSDSAVKSKQAPARRDGSGRKRDAAWRKRASDLDGARETGLPLGFEPALATLRAAPPTGDDWLHELKWDGYRLLVDLDAGKARLRSRGGLDWNATFREIARAVEALPVSSACLDGELVVIDAAGRSDFSELQRVVEGTSKADLRYMVFDLPGLAGVDLRRAPLQARKALLKDLLGTPGLLAYSDHVVGHGAEVFAQTGKQGLEGMISKRCGSPYRAGRGGDWIKSKHALADEFLVIGYTPPKGSRSGFGSLLLATRERGRLRYAGRVGTGFDDTALRVLHERLQPLRQREGVIELPAHVPFSARAVRWVRPELVVEVAYRGLAKEGLLRQASFLRVRDDKPAREVQRPPAAPTREEDVNLTHPDRIVFKDAGCTKADVADYYRSVAGWMLPGLRDRPLSLLRCPEGAQGECFFQKHHAGSLGSQVHALPLRQKDGKADYLYVDSIEGVLELVQMNTIEFHPWGACARDPERPDRLVFDLDPGEGVAWKQVVAAARDTRDKLRQAGLESFVRLSGGKGLHVVAPIEGGPSWDAVRGFCEAFAQAMALHAPDRYVATMSKARRGGKVFIDWLRNTRGATSVASWSLRARKGAPVAVPLRWEELGRIKRADAYDLPKARRRAARLRDDPWAGIDTLRQSLPALHD